MWWPDCSFVMIVRGFAPVASATASLPMQRARPVFPFPISAPSRLRGARRNDRSVFSAWCGAFVMRNLYEAKVAEQTEIQRTIMQGAARMCSGKFGRAWKALHAIKAAEALAAATGMSTRAAAYELSGEREPSARSIAALIVEITKRD